MKEIQIRVGDVVLIDLPHVVDSNKRSFVAEVTQVHPHLARGTIIHYKRLNEEHDEDRDMCHVTYIKRIVSREPYRCQFQRVNVYARPMDYITEKLGGYHRGLLTYLVSEALASVRHVDLAFSLRNNFDKIYAKAGSPGRVYHLTSSSWWGGHAVTVRWKPFRKWVHRNAQQLILSKHEAVAEAKAFEFKMDEEMDRDTA